MEKVWYNNDSVNELTRMLRVRNKDSDDILGIDVFEQSVFTLSFAKKDLISFNKDDMKIIYEFLRVYYENDNYR